MRKIFLGFTFLLSAFIPIGSSIFMWVLSQAPREFINSVPHIYWDIGRLLSTYLFSAIIVMLFFKYSQLKDRLENNIPAQNIMLFGVVIYSIYLAAYMVATTVEGGGGAYTVLQFSPFIIWPAKVALIYSAITVLLTANPRAKGNATL